MYPERGAVTSLHTLVYQVGHVISVSTLVIEEGHLVVDKK